MRQGARIPKIIGGYQRIRLLGRGGMGEVWLATKQGLEKPCVLKILRPELALNPRYRKRFLREAEIFAGLRHGRIVPVLDYGEDKGLLYIVMEFIDGVNLGTFCAALANDGEQLPMVAVAYIMAEIFDALRHAHNRTRAGVPRGVIHRDVTPGNVLISSEGEVFLTDFGIARYEQDFSSEMLGTMGYVAPEQARGAACPQSDIFSATGVMHFMLTGQPPRQVAHHGELHASLNDPPPPTGRHDVPAPLELLRGMGLEPSLDRRVATVIDALALVEGWEGYRRAATMLMQLYLRHIGPQRSGWTGMLAKAGLLKEGGGGTVVRTNKISARDEPSVSPEDAPPEDASPEDASPEDSDLAILGIPNGAPMWRPWLPQPPEAEVPEDRRPSPPGPIEDDAPRVLRRRRRTSPITSGPPPVAIDATEPLPPLGDVVAPATTERMPRGASDADQGTESERRDQAQGSATSTSEGQPGPVDLDLGASGAPAPQPRRRRRRGGIHAMIIVLGLTGALGLAGALALMLARRSTEVDARASDGTRVERARDAREEQQP